MMTDDCTCTPGTEADGWHEVRCALCHAEDMKAWHEALRHRIGFIDYLLSTAS